jgi:hypothetical protein
VCTCSREGGEDRYRADGVAAARWMLRPRSADEQCGGRGGPVCAGPPTGRAIGSCPTCGCASAHTAVCIGVSLPARYLILASHSLPNSSLVALTHSTASPRTSYPNAHAATGYCHRVSHRDDAQWARQPLVDCLVLHCDSTGLFD